MKLALETVSREHSVAAGKVRPWVSNPYALVSWWDMKPFPVQAFLIFARQFQKMASESEQHDDSVFSDAERRKNIDGLMNFAADFDSYSLTSASDQAMRMVRELEAGTTNRQMGKMLPELLNRLEDECSRRKMMMIEPSRAEFYDQPELFGVEVNAKFPTLQYDVVEAGNCYAVGRGTACVFHLMRIMEVGVQGFGDRLGVTFTDRKDWHNIIDEINKAIKALSQRDGETVALSHAASHLYNVKVGWRNRVMHPHDKYTLEEAENLIRLVKLFMGQLASII